VATTETWILRCSRDHARCCTIQFHLIRFFLPFQLLLQVWFRCFGANKSIPKELHDAADGHRQMHLNFKRMLLGLKKARQYLLTGSAEHSFALAFELIDIDGNQVLDFVEIVRWFHSWILYDVWHFGEDPGAILEFYFK
jgi:hypothetical protein